MSGSIISLALLTVAGAEEGKKYDRYFDADPCDDELARDTIRYLTLFMLAACYAASLQGTVALGERTGQLLLRVGTTPDNGAQPPGVVTICMPGFGSAPKIGKAWRRFAGISLADHSRVSVSL